MRLAHLSDFHFTRLTCNPFRLFSKRFLGHLNWLALRRKHFFEEQVEPLPALLKELKVDLVLFGGDFSTTALPQEFKRAKEFVDQIKQPWIAVAGNHDHYTYRSYRNKHFYHHFPNQRSAIQYPVEFFTLKDHGVEAHRLKEGLWLVALDTALATHPYSSQGLFSEKLEAYLEEVLSLIPPQDTILMLNHYPFFQHGGPRHSLIRGEALQALLKRNPHIRLYMHGHTHRHTVADLQVSNLPLILDSGSCAQGKKGSWNLIDLEEQGCKVSTYRWDHKWTKTQTENFVWTR
jgi:3',5'-cyclic AMP phosphodiesterase CpdA